LPRCGLLRITRSPRSKNNKPITLTGKVTKVEWTNPHIFIYVDVTDDKGAVLNWAFEMGGPTR